MARSKSSKKWLKEHFDDLYVKKSKEEGYRSRASYKLLEIQDKDRLIRPGMTVVDLGAAPGGWSQVAAKLLGGSGRLIASDILDMEPIEGVHFIQGDFTENEVLDALLEAVEDAGADLVMSDMAPNISGMKQIDQPRAVYLAELTLDLARQILKPGGTCVVKLFQGAEFVEFRDSMREVFASVKTRKPQASRARSNEVYLLGTGFGG